MPSNDDRLRPAARFLRFHRLFSTLGFLAALASAGCATAPPAGPYGGPQPFDSAAPVPPVTESGVLGVYVSGRPVLPLPWREQNERVAPGRQQ